MALACTLSNYYSGVSWGSLSGPTLRAALRTHIRTGHTTIPYTSTNTDCWDALTVLDEDPEINGNVIELYSQQSVSALANVDSSGWNREHVWPKSYGVGYTGADTSDVHSLRVADWSVNSARGNKPFGECAPADDPACTSPAHVEAGADTAANPSLFMPPAAVRGDIARSLFYMATRYDGADANTEALELSSCPQSLGFAMGNLTTLLRWHVEDPPDALEVNRTGKVCSLYQNNRNPYVDFPGLADRVWGPANHDDFVCRTDYSVVTTNSTPSPTPPPSTSPRGPCLLLTGLLDADLSGGMPKAVELVATCDVSPFALSQYGLGSANNGGGTDGQEFSFPAAGEVGSTSLTRGQFITVTYEPSSYAGSFFTYFGQAPNFTASALNVNGDDALELFWQGAVIDVFGDPDVDGSGHSWEYTDGFAYRQPGTTSSTDASAVWQASDWSVSKGALSGYASNAMALANGAGFPRSSFVLASPTAAPTLPQTDEPSPVPTSNPTLAPSATRSLVPGNDDNNDGGDDDDDTFSMASASPLIRAGVALLGLLLVAAGTFAAVYYCRRPKEEIDEPLRGPRHQKAYSIEFSLQSVYRSRSVSSKESAVPTFDASTVRQL